MYGSWGGRCPRKKSSAANADRSGNLGRYSGNLALGRLGLGSYFQGFSLEYPQNLEVGASQGQKWVQHPQNRGIQCFQPLGPTFVDPKVSVWDPVAGAYVRVP